MKDKEDAKASCKELLDLVNRHGRRSHLNAESHLEVNMGTNLEPPFVATGAKLKGRLENRMIALLNGYIDVFP